MSVANYYDLCRLCLNDNSLRLNLFDEEAKRRQLRLRVERLLSIRVEPDDFLPKYVCYGCVMKIEAFDEYKVNCVRAENLLKAFIPSVAKRTKLHQDSLKNEKCEKQLYFPVPRHVLDLKYCRDNAVERRLLSTPFPFTCEEEGIETTLKVPLTKSGVSSLSEKGNEQALSDLNAPPEEKCLELQKYNCPMVWIYDDTTNYLLSQRNMSGDSSDSAAVGLSDETSIHVNESSGNGEDRMCSNRNSSQIPKCNMLLEVCHDLSQSEIAECDVSSSSLESETNTEPSDVSDSFKLKKMSTIKTGASSIPQHFLNRASRERRKFVKQIPIAPQQVQTKRRDNQECVQSGGIESSKEAMPTKFVCNSEEPMTLNAVDSTINTVADNSMISPVNSNDHHAEKLTVENNNSNQIKTAVYLDNDSENEPEFCGFSSSWNTSLVNSVTVKTWDIDQLSVSSDSSSEDLPPDDQIACTVIVSADLNDMSSISDSESNDVVNRNSSAEDKLSSIDENAKNVDSVGIICTQQDKKQSFFQKIIDTPFPIVVLKRLNVPSTFNVMNKSVTLHCKPAKKELRSKGNTENNYIKVQGKESLGNDTVSLKTNVASLTTKQTVALRTEKAKLNVTKVDNVKCTVATRSSLSRNRLQLRCRSVNTSKEQLKKPINKINENIHSADVNSKSRKKKEDYLNVNKHLANKKTYCTTKTSNLQITNSAGLMKCKTDSIIRVKNTLPHRIKRACNSSFSPKSTSMERNKPISSLHPKKYFQNSSTASKNAENIVGAGSLESVQLKEVTSMNTKEHVSTNEENNNVVLNPGNISYQLNNSCNGCFTSLRTSSEHVCLADHTYYKKESFQDAKASSNEFGNTYECRKVTDRKQNTVSKHVATRNMKNTEQLKHGICESKLRSNNLNDKDDDIDVCMNDEAEGTCPAPTFPNEELKNRPEQKSSISEIILVPRSCSVQGSGFNIEKSMNPTGEVSDDRNNKEVNTNNSIHCSTNVPPSPCKSILKLSIKNDQSTKTENQNLEKPTNCYNPVKVQRPPCQLENGDSKLPLRNLLAVRTCANTVKERTRRVKFCYECNYCGKTFAQRSKLNIHSQLHSNEKLHGGQKEFRCKVCWKTFTQKNALVNHSRVHREKPYLCNMCHKSFHCSTALCAHIRTHLNEKCYDCKHCHKKFTLFKAFNVHRRVHN